MKKIRKTLALMVVVFAYNQVHAVTFTDWVANANAKIQIQIDRLQLDLQKNQNVQRAKMLIEQAKILQAQLDQIQNQRQMLKQLGQFTFKDHQKSLEQLKKINEQIKKHDDDIDKVFEDIDKAIQSEDGESLADIEEEINKKNTEKYRQDLNDHSAYLHNLTKELEASIERQKKIAGHVEKADSPVSATQANSEAVIELTAQLNELIVLQTKLAQKQLEKDKQEAQLKKIEQAKRDKFFSRSWIKK